MQTYSMIHAKINILIVDDTPANLVTLRHVLDDDAYSLIEATSGEETLEILFEQPDIALILMDVQMPGMDGFETVELIKSRKQCAEIPVIFLTALSSDDAHIAKGFKSGAIDYVIKPYKPNYLQAKVAAFVEIYLTQNRLKTEILQRKEAEHQLKLSSQIFNHSSEGIIITDTNSIIQAVNPTFNEITGYSADEAIGNTPKIISSGLHGKAFYNEMWLTIKHKGVWEGEIRNKRKNGEIYPEWLKIVAIKDEAGEPVNYIASFSDISSHSTANQRLYYLAHYDSLTKLPNRSLFHERLKTELANSHRRDTIFAVLFMDLDHFKNINDTLGHDVGDELLKEVAGRLLQCTRDNDLISRQGGDEFTGILVDLTHPEDAAVVAEKMIQTLSQPINIGSHELFITSSIGISIYPNDGETLETLIKHADSAMYQAKECGRNNYQFFTKGLHQASKRRFELETHLRKALENDEFEVYYQPQVDARHSCIVGMESLLRWHSPELGEVSPFEFIPVAEETGLIVPIGTWVLRTACAQCKKWTDSGYPPLLIAVNLSSRQFREPNFINMLIEVVCETKLSPLQLELELTESIIMKDDEETNHRLQEISECGFQLSIDDFGTGYSSMSYLKRFPLDKLKIDKSFVDHVTTDSDDEAIVTAMINLAHSLKLNVIAEGVETKEQLEWLAQHDCDNIQGYYFSKPLPVEEFETFMNNNLKVHSDRTYLDKKNLFLDDRYTAF
ncbi:MAG: EAL domain-containing protein [Mariprofundaceae bacterium]